jgi:translation initiation factor 5B
MKEAIQGAEVAIAVEGVTVGRQIDEGDVLLVDIPESHARKLRKIEMTMVEREVFEELLDLHRKEDHFWGR